MLVVCWQRHLPCVCVRACASSACLLVYVCMYVCMCVCVCVCVYVYVCMSVVLARVSVYVQTDTPRSMDAVERGSNSTEPRTSMYMELPISRCLYTVSPPVCVCMCVCLCVRACVRACVRVRACLRELKHTCISTQTRTFEEVRHEMDKKEPSRLSVKSCVCMYVFYVGRYVCDAFMHIYMHACAYQHCMQHARTTE